MPGVNGVLGLGVDLCDIRRVEAVLQRHPERFLRRIFTDAEHAVAHGRQGRARYGAYAKRWAAKEACAKALGTGFSQGVFHQDISVVTLPGGQPTLSLEGGALQRLQALVPQGARPLFYVSLTDDYPYAFAQVIISCAAG